MTTEEILKDDFFKPFFKATPKQVKLLKKMTAEEFALNQHFFYGGQIRNHFKLWDSESEYHKYFIEKGVFHPDSMSNEILIKLYDSLIEHYLSQSDNYWEEYIKEVKTSKELCEKLKKELNL